MGEETVMSESAPEGTAEAAAPAETPAQDATDWKAQARKWEERAKANATAASQLAEIEESKKTETQKLQEQLAQYEQRATQAERDRERLVVIAKHGIPEEYHDLIHGTDSETLAASAAKVKSLITANAQPKNEASFVIPSEGGSPALALNGDGLEASLKKALGIV
jgi:hypothetical protein